MSLLQPKANVTGGLQYQSSQEVALFGTLSVGLGCFFLYINIVLLLTLRSKQVFRETSRFILLYNLLFGDTAFMVSGILVYLFAALRIKITYHACGAIVIFSDFTATISPLTLAVMSIERYVAVCFPLRHAAVFTIRTTGMAVALVWVFSFINILIRVSILLYLLTKTNISLYLNDFCSKEAIFFAQVFYDLDQAKSGIIFLSAGLTIFASYIGVALVARAVTTDKASARKALQTLLLQAVQLGLILTSTIFSSVMAALSKTLGRLTLTQVYNVFFMFLNILPRCLGALIYGLKDQTIRPVLMQNLCCRIGCLVFHNQNVKRLTNLVK